MLIGIDASRATVAHQTGTEYYSLRLIEALLALDTAHHFRLYFNQRVHPGAFAEDGVPQARVERCVIPFPRLWTHFRLGLEVARHPPDVLFVPSHVLPLWTQARAVVTVHDLGYLFFPQTHPVPQRWYLTWATRHNARTARIVIADSDATKMDLVSQYRIPPAKIVVAYPGFDSDLTPVADLARIASAKERYGIRDDFFLHVGTLHPRKNLVRLVQAFARLRSKRPIQLVLAGKKGWLYDTLFEQVRQMGLEDRVLFPGYVDDSDKAALVSGAIAYVFPSLHEGFGFPVLEAQACDTPLICSNSSSLPEIAGDGALLIDPLDIEALTQAMNRVLNDERLRADLVARGRRNRQRFSWHACAEGVMAALEKAAAIENDEMTANPR